MKYTQTTTMLIDNNSRGTNSLALACFPKQISKTAATTTATTL